ncbi:MAG: pyridoxamine 5'-phosphate oxidase family protein [Pirellulales bacterium]
MVELRAPRFESQRLLTTVCKILDSTRLCSLATVTPAGAPYINTTFISRTSDLRVHFLSDPATQHCKNIAEQPLVAMTVFSTEQGWGEGLSGLQIFGTASLASAEEGEANYAERFDNYREYWRGLSDEERSEFPGRFYVVQPTRIKIFDEDDYGEDVYVDAEVLSDR